MTTVAAFERLPRWRSGTSDGSPSRSRELADLLRGSTIGLSTAPEERDADEQAARAVTATPGPVPVSTHDGAGGRPLSPQERRAVGAGFGHDYSRVRVHDDAAARESARSLGARAYTVGNHVVAGDAAHGASWPRVLRHELAHVAQAGRAPGRPVVRRVSLGVDGALSPPRQAVVRAAAEIAERLVATGEFAQKWDRFWSGAFKTATPRPTLEVYRTAVRGRVVHDMDTSADPQVRGVVTEERDMPLERQTAAVTKVGSRDTYLRQFAADQGVDAVVSLLLHESFHGAGVAMGGNPVQSGLMIYEPLMHGFETGAGFPMFMGGADIGPVTQVRHGDYDVDVTVPYTLRTIDAPLPSEIEIQVVSPETGEVITQEEPDATRKPVRRRIPSRVGAGTWVWHARYAGIGAVTVRIVDGTGPTVMASRPVTPNPRCVLGVSSQHCEGE